MLNAIGNLELRNLATSIREGITNGELEDIKPEYVIELKRLRKEYKDNL